MRSGMIGLAAACAVVFIPPAPAATTHEVVIRDYRFAPAELRIAVGDSVRWINREKRASHSLLFEAEGLAESERLFADDSWERRFSAPGRHPYRCGPHPEMQGVILVE